MASTISGRPGPSASRTAAARATSSSIEAPTPLIFTPAIPRATAFRASPARRAGVTSAPYMPPLP